MPRRLTERRATAIILAILFIAVAHIDFVNLIRRHNLECVIPFPQCSDEAFYYAFAHSLAFDGDADLTNEFRFIAFGPIGIDINGLFYGDYFEGPKPMISKVGFGTALLTLPFILAARAAVALYHACGGPAVHRFAAVYLWTYKLGMLFWSFIGIAAAYALLRRLGRSMWIAAGAVVAAVLGLSIGFYIVFQNLWSHIISFGWVTLFLLCCARWHENMRETPGRPLHLLLPLMVGLAGGLCCSIRFNNLLILPVPLIVCVHEGLRRVRGDSPARRGLRLPVLLSFGAIGAGLFIGFLPQMLVWRSMYGEWIVNTYGRFGEHLQLWPRYLLGILFSPRCGLFLWTPLAALGTAGIAAGIRREGRQSPWPWICAYILLADVWFSGCFPGWHMGNSFGARYQSDYTFVFAYGLSVVFAGARGRRCVSLVLKVTVVVLVLWNFYLMEAFRASVIGSMDVQLAPRPFCIRTLVAERRTILQQLNTDLSRLFDAGLYTDYRRRYPLMTPADLGLPSPEERQRDFDGNNQMGELARWRRICIEHSERIIYPGGRKRPLPRGGEASPAPPPS
jgi:hypothetical protein